MSALEQTAFASISGAAADGDADPILVARATALIPALRARARETDALSRLPDSTIKDLNNGRLMELLTPRRYGGLANQPRDLQVCVCRDRPRLRVGRLGGRADQCLQLARRDALSATGDR